MAEAGYRMTVTVISLVKSALVFYLRGAMARKRPHLLGILGIALGRRRASITRLGRSLLVILLC